MNNVKKLSGTSKMKLQDYLLKYKSKLTEVQKIFLEEIYYKDFGEIGLNYIQPNITIEKQKYDFVIKTKKTSYAINTISQNSSKNESNETKLDYKIISFSETKIKKEKNECIWELRRNFISDKDLSDVYLKRTGEVMPHEVQEEVLLKLKDSRLNGINKGLVILATGLGKTFLAGFDVKQFKPKRVLFIVHIEEILKQTLKSFQKALPERSKEMGLLVGKNKDKDKNILFASIQTLSKQKNLEYFENNYFDYIIFDETHHNAAPTYRKVLNYFKPKFLLGLTATPERMDRQEILPFYDNNIIYEMCQQDAIKRGFLVPFNYYGFKDNIDYSNIYFNGFSYDISDLNKKLLIKERDDAIIEKYKELGKGKKTIGFCVSIEHANWCAEKFKEAGISAVAIHSKLDETENTSDTKDTEKLIRDFRESKFQIAFVVNMFNEGIDIPDVECLLFLRPTESKTIFIQHLGRGLRVYPDKEKVIVLDFIGNYRTACTVLSGLGIQNGVRGLIKEKRNEKDVFVFNNNGCKIVFESEVVDIFKSLESLSSKEVKKEFISEEWIEYADYLENWTKNNLYWKRGQQNQCFEVQLEALNIICNNPKITEKDFIKEIQIIVDSKYPGKGMTAGFRSLILSKLCGLVNGEVPLKVTEPFITIKKYSNKNFKNLSKYQEILTNQLEKIFYWNSLYGTFNKYVTVKNRVSFKDFKVYPFFFIYEILLRLIDDYGYDNSYLSEIEFNSFLAVAKNHNESSEVLDKILKFRNYEEKDELKKLLKEKNHIDPRFYKIIGYNKYLIVDKNGVKLNEDYIDELREKMKKFRKIFDSGNLIIFREDSSQDYFKMLYSKNNLIEYHLTQKKFKKTLGLSII